MPIAPPSPSAYWARPVPEALSETNCRLWAQRLLTAIALYYRAQAAWLFVAPLS